MIKSNCLGVFFEKMFLKGLQIHGETPVPELQIKCSLQFYQKRDSGTDVSL